MTRADLARVVLIASAASIPAVGAGQPPDPQPRFKSSAVAVVVDATVRDRDGKPVRCLTASDFEVFEDGQRQEVRSFEAVDVPECAARPEPSGHASPPSLAQVLSTPPPVTALVFEELGATARADAWHAAEVFVDEGRRPDEFVGIFVVDARAVYTMVPYSRDRDALMDGLRRVAMRPGCPIETGGSIESAAGPSTCIHGGTNLKGLRAVTTSMSHLPGRKNVVLFSEGFVVSAHDNTIELFERLTSDANHGTVTFHVVDAAGLRLAPERRVGLDSDPASYLQRIALDTGGQYVGGGNDFTGAMRRVMADMRDYYRLTYQPSNEALDGRYRAIKVTVGVPGAVVVSRAGYRAEARPASMTVVPADVAPHVLLDAGKLPADFSFACVATRVGRDISVSATIEASVLALVVQSGGFEGALSVLARLRDKDGRVVAATSETSLLKGRTDQLAAAARRRVQFGKTLPASGAETLEVIAYDVMSGKASARRFKVKDLKP
jgi:VWFA-related protein